MRWKSLRLWRNLLKVGWNLFWIDHFQGLLTYLGWFVIESELNQKYLTVKEGKASSGQQVVNSSPKTDKQGQLWMWKEGYLLSKLDRSLVLDGTFGKVSIKKKKHGNIYQKWRFVCFHIWFNFSKKKSISKNIFVDVTSENLEDS